MSLGPQFMLSFCWKNNTLGQYFFYVTPLFLYLYERAPWRLKANNKYFFLTTLLPFKNAERQSTHGPLNRIEANNAKLAIQNIVSGNR
jgi:hypothetical protein